MVAKAAWADTIPTSTDFKGCDMIVMNKSTFMTTLLVGMILLTCFFSLSAEGALKGGTAKVDITPPIGVWLSGYGSRNKPSEDILDPYGQETGLGRREHEDYERAGGKRLPPLRIS